MSLSIGVIVWLVLVLACRDGKIATEDSVHIDSDGDGFTIAEGDCDDSNADVFPSAVEECDGIDNDCDGEIDPPELAGSLFFLDQDEDGFGGEEAYACVQPVGYVSMGGDCNDEDEEVFPDAIEQCGDEIDQNCDGLIDNEACFYTVNDAPFQFYSDPLYPLGVGGKLTDINGDGVVDMVTNAPIDLPIVGISRAFHIFEAPFAAEQTSLDAAHRILLSSYDKGGAFVRSSDFNGDGQMDLVLSSDGNDYAGSNAGAVYLIWGPVSDSLSLEDEYDMRWTGVEGSFAGYSVADLGDVTGDGRSDLVVGAHEYGGSIEEGGAVYIIFGRDEESMDASLSDADVVLLGGADDNLGYEVASAGDLNGDGVLDIAINAYRFDTTERNAGRTFVFFGPIDSSLTLSQADIRIDGYEEIGQLGATLASLPDMDGDGMDDLLVASQFAEADDASLVEDEGAAFVLVGLTLGDVSLQNSSAKIVGEHEAESFGREASGLGDVDGDGYGDVLISSKRYGIEALEQGRSSLFLGPLEGTYTSGQGHALLYGAQAQAWTGITMDVYGEGADAQLLLGSRVFVGDDVFGSSFLLPVDFF